MTQQNEKTVLERIASSDPRDGKGRIATYLNLISITLEQPGGVGVSNGPLLVVAPIDT